MSTPYLPLYTDALLGDIRVQSLSGPERAYWILLLIYLWQSDGKLKDDPALLSRLLQCTQDQWLSLREAYITTGLLKSNESTLYNNRTDKELCKAEYLSNVRRENIKKRWEKKGKRKKKQ